MLDEVIVGEYNNINQDLVIVNNFNIIWLNVYRCNLIVCINTINKYFMKKVGRKLNGHKSPEFDEDSDNLGE